MKPRTRSILTGFISALFLLAVVLSLPLLMNHTMKDSLNFSASFAEEELPKDDTASPAQETESQSPPVEETPPAIQVPAETPREEEQQPDLQTPEPEPSGERLQVPLFPTDSSFRQEGQPRLNLEGNNWRRLLVRDPELEDLNVGAFALLFARIGVKDLQERLVRGYLDKNSSLMILESLTTQDAAYQKVFSGMLSNLGSKSIFLPLQALSAYEGQAVLAAARWEGGGSVFMMPNRGLMPFSVMQYAGHQGHVTLTPDSYQRIEEEMMAQALDSLPKEEGQRLQDCLDKALDVLHRDGEPGADSRYAFISARPFQFKIGWDYLAAGYHLTMVDTQSAGEFTLSVDLLSGGIGIAEEGATPYLDLHDRLVMQDRENTAWQTNPEPVWQRTAELFSLLMGPVWQEEKQGMVQNISSITSNMDQPVLQVDMVPEDLDQRLLDQANAAPYTLYTLQMDRDLKLLSLDVQTQLLQETQASDFVTLYLPREEEGPVSLELEDAYTDAISQVEALRLQAHEWDTSGELAMLLDKAHGQRVQLVNEALDIINQTGGNYHLEEELQGWPRKVSLWLLRQRDHQEKNHDQVRLSFSVQDEEGKYYHVAFRVNRDMSIAITGFVPNDVFAPAE